MPTKRKQPVKQRPDPAAARIKRSVYQIHGERHTSHGVRIALDEPTPEKQVKSLSTAYELLQADFDRAREDRSDLRIKSFERTEKIESLRTARNAFVLITALLMVFLAIVTIAFFRQAAYKDSVITKLQTRINTMENESRVWFYNTPGSYTTPSGKKSNDRSDGSTGQAPDAVR